MTGIFTALAILLAVTLPISAESNIGCLFSNAVCDTEEWCFDDHAFGRCLPIHGRLEEDSFYQYDLQVDMLEKLEEEMSALFRDGYHWTHAYTQCIVQNLLFSHRFGFDYRPSLCEGVSGADGTALQEETQPRDLAVIHFDPASSRRLEDELSDFASEWFVPPLNGQQSQPHLYGRAQKYGDTDEQYPKAYYESNNANKHKRVGNVLDSSDYADEDEQEEEPKLSSKEMLDLIELLSARALESGNDDGQLDERSTEQNDQWAERNRDRASAYYSDVSPEEFDQLQALFSASAPVHSSDGTPDGATDTQADWFYMIGPRGEAEDGLEYSGEMENPAGYGGNYYDGFKRLHRYDVKKPGPNFMDNLEDFDSTEAVVKEQLNQVDLYKFLEQMFQDKMNESRDIVDEPQEREDREEQQEENGQQLMTAEGMSNLRPINEEGEKEYETILGTKPQEEADESEVRFASDTAKRKPGTEMTSANGKYTPSLYGIQQYSHKDLPSETTKDYDVIDTSYAYITTKNGFENWKEGAEFVKQLEKMLNLPEDTFSNIRVDQNQVTFKVNENPQGLNASTVASKAESMASKLSETTGKDVTNTGIGNQVKISILNLDPDKKLFIITFVVCGCIAGILIAVAVLYVIRRHARSKEKLQALAQPETEPSHDYQDLCRQRMANKNNEKPEPIHVGQRVTNLSRESETSARSPSSRSSTSSWSEEPVTSNMDISTGHMVLSYMEDHLKNKDRLEQEWVALCAYEAEPCNTTAALAAENVKKNRYADVLPYDHSRVVLNDLTNINGSDFINASTITDHDPRNPAYIATQGPLPHTAADFWQMVWEQGSVVVVTLSRLVENGIAMCHRYWPEEGSELYHIYEVHLVSEHIWCDDYLVRSFYLKNLKTGETRTVTQFHFLSWPDNGVPVSVKALLDFRRKVNKSYRGRSCPIVVHCSDGSGRTGTYCLIDMVLNRMAKGAKEIDIAATLEHIRDQRCFMVKTKGQFEFALMAVAEEVHAILKALPQ